MREFEKARRLELQRLDKEQAEKGRAQAQQIQEAVERQFALERQISEEQGKLRQVSINLKG